MSQRAHLRSVPVGQDAPAPAQRAPAEERGYGFVPRGLRREAAAFYVGVSPAKFDQWVAGGLMPQPKEDGGVVVWDRWALDESFGALPNRQAKPKADPYGDVAT